MADKARRLGRGLEALFGAPPGISNELKFSARVESDAGTEFRSIPVSSITPNPRQPRKDFDEADLAELRSSIRANGLLQPLLVRPLKNGFELVAGERRLRAVQSLGWREVAAHVRAGVRKVVTSG